MLTPLFSLMYGHTVTPVILVTDAEHSVLWFAGAALPSTGLGLWEKGK